LSTLTNIHNQVAMSKGIGTVRIGTSGVVVPGSKATFAKEFHDTSRLHYYARLFETLEINSSFYKVPKAATFEKWSNDVPQDFKFTVKLYREITHAKNLAYDIEQITNFVKALAIPKRQQGCLLIQFPASISNAYHEHVEKLLQTLTKLNADNGWQLVVEFRDADWYVQSTNDLLDRYRASIVLHDMPKSKTELLNEKASVAYVRFHGPKGDYRGSYTDEILNEWAAKIKAYQKRGIDVYVYFNNTIGNAFENAQLLRSLLNPRS